MIKGDMRRLCLVIILSLAIPIVVVAGPKEVLSKVAHVVANHVTLDLYTGASSGIATAGTYECRENNGPEPCTGHYGSARGIEISRAIGTAGAIAWSEYGRRRGYKDWWLPAVAVATFNTSWGIHEGLIAKREKEHAPRPRF